MSQDSLPWAQMSTGVVTPQFFDGQVLAAADLSLAQGARDAELARMRVLLHGWGVVAGLIPGVTGDRLLITPGYGVLPDGTELYLPEPLDITLPTEQELATLCGTLTDSCALPTSSAGDDGEEPDAAAEATTVWLAIGATAQAAAPRTAVGTGCTHPGNTAQPTRWCHAVALYLLCQLPENHLPAEETCKELGSYVCAPDPLPVPFPDPAPGPNVLVLGRLTPAYNDTGATVDFNDRRRLLPNHVLQAWLRSCICPLTEEQKPGTLDWAGLRQRMTELGMDQLSGTQRPAAVLRLYEPSTTIRATPVTLLIRAGILGPVSFLATPPATLAGLTKLTGSQIKQAGVELQRIREETGF